MVPSVMIRLTSIITFLLIMNFCLKAFQRQISILGPWMEAAKTRGTFEWSDGSFPLWDSFWHVKPIDELWRAIVIAFVPSTFEIDPLSWWQMVSFLVDAGVVYTIWVIEANRVGNKRSSAYLPAVVGQIFQVVGAGIVAPIYYIAHLLSAPRPPVLTSETRKFDLASMRTLLASVTVAYYIPVVSAYFGSTKESRHWWTWIWQMFPIFVGLSQYLLSRLFPETPARNSLKSNATRDWFYVQITLYSLAAFSTLVWLYTLFFAPYSMRQIFVPDASKTGQMDALRLLLQYDHISFFGATLLWMLYLAIDLRMAGMTNKSLFLEAGGLVGLSVVVGPGATVALSWLRRELRIIERTNGGQRVH